MKKLEDIPKKSLFKVPDGYFDRLPTIIQSRIADKPERRAPQVGWAFTLKYALPVLAFAGIALFWLLRANNSFEDQLNLIDSEQIALYLDDSDLTTDDLAETMTWSTEDLDALEADVFSMMSASEDELNQMLDDYKIDLENF